MSFKNILNNKGPSRYLCGTAAIYFSNTLGFFLFYKAGSNRLGLGFGLGLVLGLGAIFRGGNCPSNQFVR